MRPLFITWEYPPYKTGGIASHCHDLATTLAEQGHDPVVISHGEEATTDSADGVEIHRVTTSNHAPDTVSWAMQFGFAAEQRAITIQQDDPVDLVHAHDWMAVPGATGIKKTLGLPMAFTVHSTQQGRQGVHDPYQQSIQSLEWYGTYEAQEVIAVGRDLRDEVRRQYQVPDDKIRYIPNGVDLSRFDDHSSDSFTYNDYAQSWEKIVLFLGRLYPQKGPGYFIDAMPSILDDHPEAKFVIAGKGNEGFYRPLAESKAGSKVFFPGFIPDDELVSLLQHSYVTVAPSVYEPFGIVPLESSACHTPPVASYVGGIKDTVVHEYTGLHTYPQDPGSIARQVNRALDNPEWVEWMGNNAREYVEENFRWEGIAAATASAYGNVF